MSSTETATQRLKQPEVNRGGSTQAGCTPWLIISCVVLAATTAFVFGWGLGAPNMYNHYTEPFLKGHDPCTANQQAHSNKSLTPPVMDARNTADGSYAENAEVQRNENGEAIAAESTTTPKPLKEPFNFVLELVKGIPQTIFLIGAFIGAITGPFWGKYFDRKRTVFANYIFCFASSLCVLLAYYFKQPWLFYLSRLLLGYQGGMACAVVPPYLGEISSQRVRGSAGVAFQLGLTLGILFAQLIGSPRIAGTCTGWGWGLSIVFLLPLAGIFLLLLIPNSPTQMIGTYNNVEQAREDLIKLRKMPNVDADIQDIEEQTRQTTGSKAKSLSIPQVLTSTHYRWPMLTTVVLQFAQALSGVNAIFFYSSKMFAKAGIKPEYIPYANIGTGLINVITTIVAVFLIDKLGRKKLIIWPMGVMVVVFALLTALVQVNESRNSATLGLLSVILILLFVVCFAVGLGPIPYLYGTEVCRPEARDAVQSIGLIANYVGNILLSLFFPALNSALGGYVFLIFVVVISLNIAFLSVKMFETKNRTIEDAERFWKISPTPAKDTELKEHFIQPTTTVHT